MAITVVKQMTLADLRAMFTEQFEQLRDGKASAANVNAFANLGGKYLQSIKLELEAVKLLGQTPTHIQSLLTQGPTETSAPLPFDKSAIKSA